MPRLVRFERTDPIKIDPASLPTDESGAPKPIFICACGISAKFPFCDGSHKVCRQELPDTLYRYDPATRAPEPIGPDSPKSNPINPSPDT